MDDHELNESDAVRNARLMKVLNSHIAQLAEHFGTVQVVCTKFCSQTGTDAMGAGAGNYYARMASVEDWLRIQKRK